HLIFIRRARALLQREQFDIVSGLTRFYPLDVYRMGGGIHKVWLRKKADSAVGRFLSFLRPFTWLALFLEKRIFDPRRCRRIIANSRLCHDQLLALYPYPPGRVTVIYNGIDHNYFNPRLRESHGTALRRSLGIPIEATVALFASNNLTRKGLDVAIDGLSRTGEKSLFLLVAGKGRSEPFLSLARTLGVSDRVRFLGPVDDMRAVYGASDLLALPTRYDPFANVCLEAMACGLPVITTVDNGASELVREGVNGFILSGPRDAWTLAAHLVALTDAARRARLAGAARETSLAYTIDRNAGETLVVYTAILEERNAHDR
ncbi:MAG: glycosyltransferase family 4 protein, partial [Candidatus Aureabacteria bacterium]|nr:glycosyltransferase family 4 protein [Candidatus Auribacterota bacterium]